MERISCGSNEAILRNPTRTRERHLNGILSELMARKTKKRKSSNEKQEKHENFLSREHLWKYKTSDATSPWLYGLIKVHKSDMPLREIASAVGSPGHDLMKAVSLILQPLVGNAASFVKDGYHFISLLRSERFSKKQGFMVSLDIKALFPSLPMEKALQILEERIKDFPNLEFYTDLSKVEIMEIVKECTANPWFECELGSFLQKDGAPMGGPLSCLLADLFMEEYEKSISFTLNSSVVPIDWLRYRDDTWFIWEYSLQDLLTFIEHLNSLHPQIQWTFELEKNGMLNFLDVLVKREDDGTFTTSVFRKPTHSDRYLHFSSNHPLQQKLSAVHSLKCRALHYCSNSTLLQNELEHLRDTFLLNGFPEPWLQHILFNNQTRKSEEQVSLISDEPEKIGCLVVPYIKEIHRQLVSLCKREGIHLLYSRQPNLGNLISPKRPDLQTMLTRSCVYQIPCNDCDAVYIGETKRMLLTRCKEHSYSCKKAMESGLVLASESYDTGLPTHAVNNAHSFDFQNTKVLRREQNAEKRKFLEAIEIMKSPNTVNITNGKLLDVNWQPVIWKLLRNDTGIT
jgi:hypothetical protein